MIRPGPRNLITDVAGVLVGNAEDAPARSGTTVVLCEEPAMAAVDLRGGAPGTVGASSLEPGGLVGAVDAVVLSGGSAFGLAAADGVRSRLAATGRGFAFGGARVPIVAGAILFDLANGGDKGWGEEPPYRELGGRACEAAARDVALGNAGAGLGATAGPLKGGLGSASFVLDAGGARLTVGALAVVNPVGSVVMPATATFWAWALEQDGELGGQSPPGRAPGPEALDHAFPGEPGTNTTLAVVATDARLGRGDAQRLAIMAQDGLARAIRPVHTPFDGDAVFVLATGRGASVDPAGGLARLGMLAADCVARAIARGVYEAKDLGEARCYRSVHGVPPGARPKS